MKVVRTSIPELLILEPRVFGDARGFFMESFNVRTFAEVTGLETDFVRDNHSRSQHACCAACTISSGRRRASWCAWPAGGCSTWRSTCVAVRPLSGAGRGRAVRGQPSAVLGAAGLCPLDSWCSPKPPTFSTRRPTTTPPSTSAALPGTIHRGRRLATRRHRAAALRQGPRGQVACRGRGVRLTPASAAPRMTHAAGARRILCRRRSKVGRAPAAVSARPAALHSCRQCSRAWHRRVAHSPDG